MAVAAVLFDLAAAEDHHHVVLPRESQEVLSDYHHRTLLLTFTQQLFQPLSDLHAKTHERRVQDVDFPPRAQHPRQTDLLQLDLRELAHLHDLLQSFPELEVAVQPQQLVDGFDFLLRHAAVVEGDVAGDVSVSEEVHLREVSQRALELNAAIDCVQFAEK